MHPKELEAVVKLEAPKRYEYFIKKTVDSEEVWGLFNTDNGWANVGDDQNNILIPLWPKMEFAALCIDIGWETYQPKAIDLDHFIDKWIPGMKEDGYKAFIFPTPEGKGIAIETDRLLNDLQLELENY